MTTPADIVQPDDPDWTSWRNLDEAFFLRAASDELRRWVGWHVTPNITSVESKLPIGQRGIIMLPSRHVTEVLEVAVKAGAAADWTVLDADTYTWHDAGWIEPVNFNLWPSYTGGGYTYGYGPAYLPVFQVGLAKVTFKHGWTEDQLPDDIKIVVMELAAQGSMLANNANVDQVSSPGYTLENQDRRPGPLQQPKMQVGELPNRGRGVTFSPIPSPHSVVHIPRHLTDTADLDTGNYEFVDGDPLTNLTRFRGMASWLMPGKPITTTTGGTTGTKRRSQRVHNVNNQG